MCHLSPGLTLYVSSDSWPVAASQALQVGAWIMVSRGMDSTVTCCRSPLMCAIIWVSELATVSLVLASVLPALPLAPARVSEPSSRMFSGAYEPGAGGATVAVDRFVSSVTTAEMLRETIPESARDLMAHSQPVAVNTITAT